MHPRILEAHFIIYLQQPIRLNKSTPKQIHVKQTTLPLDTVLCIHQRNGNSPMEGAKQLNVKGGSPCFQYRMKSRKYNPCEKVTNWKHRLFQTHFCSKPNIASLITTGFDTGGLYWCCLQSPIIYLLFPCIQFQYFHLSIFKVTGVIWYGGCAHANMFT